EVLPQRLERVLAGQFEVGKGRLVDEPEAFVHDSSVASEGGGQRTLTPSCRSCLARPWESTVPTLSTNETVSGSPRTVITLETFTFLAPMRPSRAARAPGRLATSTSSRAADS